MTPAVIYLRVSTTAQALEGISLEAQQAKAEAWVTASGYSVASVHTDAGISGSKAANRPGLQAALDAVCALRGVLVVYSLSRLARSTKDAILIAERLQKAGADLVSLSERIDTTTAAGKMIFRLLAVLAEFERDLVSERTKAALAHKASKGERVGQIPFGYCLATNGVVLLEDPNEQSIQREIRALKASGASWAEIASRLNGQGLSTKKQKKWTWQTARRAAA
jgi:site-specific DNA recombinase